MTVQEIITKYELLVGDTSELSSQEELDLFNRVYQKVCMYRQWEFLKKTATGTLSTSVPYVSLPSDFSYIVENNSYTDNAIGTPNNATPKVVFIGSDYTPYQIINWSDRRQYRDQNQFAYVDVVNSRLYFALQPTIADTYEFDYISYPATLTTSDTPAFPARFHDIIAYGMTIDDFSMQLFDKARSYAPEYQARYNDYLKEMSFWNSNLINN